MNDRRLTKYLGQRVGGGVVVGARMTGKSSVTFTVVIDGQREEHVVALPTEGA